MAQGAPISILNITDTVQINLSAINSVLDKVGDLHLACYSINGKKRTGKSFMLGYFLKYLTSPNKNGDWIKLTSTTQFEWRGGAERHTEGINVWSEPLKVKVGGRDVAIILLDTQGSFDDVTTFQDNAIVFAISTLLSSVLIFNVQNDVAEDVLQMLQYFTSYASLANEKKNPAATLTSQAEPFQKLVFLLRDYAHPMDYVYGYYDDRTKPAKQPVDGKNFKTFVLDSKPTQPVDVRFTHDQIMRNFKDVGAFLMPEPDKGLRRFDKVNEMGDEFRDHVKEFVELMLAENHIITKRVGGVEVTGKELKTFVQIWAGMFEDGVLPKIENLYNTTVKAQYEMAKKTAIDFFFAELKKIFKDLPDGMAPDSLSLRKLKIIEEAKVVYNSRSKMAGGEFYDRFTEEFDAEIQKGFEVYEKINSSRIQQAKMREEFDHTVNEFTGKIERTQQMMKDMGTANAAEQSRLREQIAQGRASQEDLKKLIERQENEKIELNKQVNDNRVRMDEIHKQHMTEMAQMNRRLLAAQRRSSSSGCVCVVM